MSKLEELIQELCPNGVEYIPLCECTFLRAGDRITTAMMDDSYEYSVMGGGTNPTGKYSNYNFENSITISRAGSAGYVNWMEEKFWATDVCFVASQKLENTLIKFIYYYVKNMQSELQKKTYGGNLPKLNKDYLWQLPIPIPPIEVQSEIVKILDNFTLLTAELTAELTSRKEQYEYYRDKLFIFNAGVARNVKIGDVILSLNTGLNPRQFFRLNTDDATNYYVTIREFKGGSLSFTQSTDRINNHALALCNNRSNLEKDDILFSGTGTIGEVYWISDTPWNWNIKEGVYSLKPNKNKILPKYLKYVLQSKKVLKNILSKSSGGTVKSIKMADLKNIEIPLPTIKEQEKIVDLLDKFDAFCNDITHGLPAEIELRQKQYEYYRNKLLTFKELK